MKVLIAGWFSAPLKTATTGDYLALHYVISVARSLGADVRVLGEEPHPKMIDAHWATPSDSHECDVLIWVCGPLFGTFPSELSERVTCRRAIAVNVSDVGHREANRAFDAIWWRDSVGTSNLDLAMFSTLATPTRTVGLLFAGPQHEYAEDHSGVVDEAVSAWKQMTNSTWVNLDTKYPWNEVGQDHELAIVGLIQSVDCLVTSRLHGLILGTALGTPVLPIEQVDGGAKVTAQATRLGVQAIRAGEVTAESIEQWVTSTIEPAPPRIAPQRDAAFERWLAVNIRGHLDE